MDELLGRKVPYSAVAEQAVIGSMLIDPRCVPDVIEKVSAEDFYLKQNKDVFETIYQMFAYSRTIDPVTVVNEMKVRGVHDDNTESYLAEVMRLTPTAANVLEYAAIVRDRAMLRHLGEAADEINTMVYEGAGEADSVLEAAEQCGDTEINLKIRRAENLSASPGQKCRWAASGFFGHQLCF